MNEISLNVTLNNQIHLHLTYVYTNGMCVRGRIFKSCAMSDSGHMLDHTSYM